MKKKNCPLDRETHFQCVAHTDTGRCKKPASVLDPQRGGFICDQHAAELDRKLREETLAKQMSLFWTAFISGIGIGVCLTLIFVLIWKGEV
jgi:hypothetical protein